MKLSHWLKKVTKNLTRVRGIYRLNSGKCPICESWSVFLATDGWLRDSYRCVRCLSIPRQRALVTAIERISPHWRELTIHESSPSGAASTMLEASCVNYSFSQYFPDIQPGDYKGDIRCENLESLSFSSDTFDIFITQDVMEHIFDPAKAFQEIARVLKPGGIHVFTTPVRFENAKSEQRALLDNGKVINIKPPEYHKNPVDENGSLVTYDFGRDFPFLVDEWSGLNTTVFLQENKKNGLEGSFLEVFISRKNG